ncbi:MAG: SDR family NAD(P)-dependent oxidoreductase [Pseudomonadales bacterium]
MRDFKNKVAVVTGAASGIGRALAEHCGDEGMAVVLADVDETALQKLKSELEGRNVKVLAVPTDVANAAAVNNLAAVTVDTFGSVDLLFNNAGVLINGFSWEKNEQEWDWILGINLKGVINGARSFIPGMLQRGTPAHIVNTASLAGLLAAPLMGPYTVGKQAVVALSETLHYELQSIGAPVKVSVLCPGQVATNILRSEERSPVQGMEKKAAQQQLEQFLRGGIDAGMSPQQCAEIVFDAIRTEKFWIFPHPEFKPAYQLRADGVMSETNPVYQNLQDLID